MDRISAHGIAAPGAEGMRQRPGADIISRQQDYIRRQAIHFRHNMPGKRRFRVLPVVDIGNLGNPQPVQGRGEPFQLNRALRDLQIVALERPRIGQQARGCTRARELKKAPPRDEMFGFFSHTFRIMHPARIAIGPHILSSSRNGHCRVAHISILRCGIAGSSHHESAGCPILRGFIAKDGRKLLLTRWQLQRPGARHLDSESGL